MPRLVTQLKPKKKPAFFSVTSVLEAKGTIKRASAKKKRAAAAGALASSEGGEHRRHVETAAQLSQTKNWTQV